MQTEGLQRPFLHLQAPDMWEGLTDRWKNGEPPEIRDRAGHGLRDLRGGELREKEPDFALMMCCHCFTMKVW